MKLGVFTILFNDLPLGEVLDYLKGLGVEAVEIGTAGYSISNHCDVDGCLESREKLEKFKDEFKKRDMFISALSAHGNPVHPDKDYAAIHNAGFEKSVLLAEKLGVDTINLLSGTPAGGPDDKVPNFITGPWPDDFAKAYEYQWNEVLIPYWTKAAKFAADHGVTKLAIEPHGNNCVHNTETLLKLRNAVGKNIGCNFDPSHFYWQGMDPALAILELKDAIFHVHAKDCVINEHIVKRNGILDAKPYSAFKERAWNFRTVGYGHSEDEWKKIMSALVTVGYDYVISVEHEDCLMTREEGLSKCIETLKRVIIKDKVKVMWWEMRAEG
ncbi:MAG TPA: sugar phosphate isomerase/epimerase [Clostridiaceae bacterium]|nr:sugar phosphate isomerase/epimerase [Clostridiaceae bacterium]